MDKSTAEKSRKKTVVAIIVSIVAVLLVVGAIGAVKASQIVAMIESGEAFVPPAIGVTTITVDEREWERSISAIGTAVAHQQIILTAEVPGRITALKFESGDTVKQGQVLLTMDTSTERAQLAAAEADADLAAVNLERTNKLRGQNAIAQAELDSAKARKAQTLASVAGLRATINKKTIRAPFSGRLGIRSADLGAVLQPGVPIVSLQSVDPMYVDFQVPEQVAATLETGLAVRATSTALDEPVAGTVETIDNRVETGTRNVRVRATIPNPEGHIRPGLFFDVEVIRPNTAPVLAVPNTAIMYAPYGNSVFVVNEKDGKLVAEQVFVRLGEKRGDFVAVTSGIKAGQTVVSTGAFKLQNGVTVEVDNSVSGPEPKAEPEPENQ